MAKKRKPQPLAPPPQSSALRSRKRARQVTTLFHKYTTERDAAVARAQKAGCCTDDAGTNNCNNNNLSSHQIQLLAEVKKWDDKLSEIGGREEYQRASQMNTSLFSTSKWVLGIVGKWGWLNGLPISITSDHCGKDDNDDKDNHKKKEDKKKGKRDVRLLEIGAINTQLLDASERTRIKTNHNNDQINNGKHGNDKTTERVYHLDVKAIDIRSTDRRIQQLDFFDLPLPNKVDIKDDTSSDTASINKQQQQQQQHYDVIVNSMVINCVTTPAQRGQMLSLCYQHLRPGGVLFLTLPKLCLIQSKSMSRSYFEEILTKGVGFEILKEVGRESPKIAFFVLRRPKKEKAREIKEDDEDQKSRTDGNKHSFDDKFTRMPVIHRGKKFRNTFAVTLNEEDCVK